MHPLEDTTLGKACARISPKMWARDASITIAAVLMGLRIAFLYPEWAQAAAAEAREFYEYLGLTNWEEGDLPIRKAVEALPIERG